MAAVAVRGSGARALLQLCLSKDLETCIGKEKTALVDGRCVYGIFLAEDGTVIDDAIVYQLRPDSFMVVVNAGMGGAIAAHLTKYVAGQGCGRSGPHRPGRQNGYPGPAGGDNPAEESCATRTAVFERLTYFSFKGGFGEFGSRHSGDPHRRHAGSRFPHRLYRRIRL